MARKKSTETVVKFNPWTEFKEWLNCSNMNIELNEKVVKAIVPRSVLCMFANHGTLTVFLNECFNNFNLYQIPPIEFFKFIKHIVHSKNIKTFSFLKTESRSKSAKELQEKLPLLKTYEIDLLLDLCKDDENYDSFAEYLGIKETKICKVTKKEKEELLKEPVLIEKKDIIVNKKEETQDIDFLDDNLTVPWDEEPPLHETINIKTWDDWKVNFK